MRSFRFALEVPEEKDDIKYVLANDVDEQAVEVS